MPDKDLWLRKIAAFLHDPPYKVWYFRKTYKGKKWRRDDDVIDVFKRFFDLVYPFLDPSNHPKILRKFHHAGASGMKNNYFGVKEKPIEFDIGNFTVIHTLSGEKVSLKDLLEISEFNPGVTEPKDNVENFLSGLKSNSEKKKFFTDMEDITREHNTVDKFTPGGYSPCR